jgi:hypothetical protein
MVSPTELESATPEPAGKFPLGSLHTTPGALITIPHQEMLIALRRHHSGDWGDLDAQDFQMNEMCLLEGCRLFSQYRSGAGEKFWVITEGDRSVTTVLLPEEY